MRLYHAFFLLLFAAGMCVLTLDAAHAQRSTSSSEADDELDQQRREAFEARREWFRSRFGGGPPEGFRGPPEGFRGPPEGFRGWDRSRDWRSSRDDSERDGDERSDRGEADSSRSSRSSASSIPSGMSIREHAVNLVRQHDKNGNMMLEGDELRELRGLSGADLDSDGVITVDELVMYLSSRQAEGTSGASERSDGRDRSRFSSFGSRRSDRDSSSDDERRRGDSREETKVKRVYYGSVGGNSEKDEKNKRRSYRFTPPTERLPDKLPSWFKQRDANGDGQVSMSEFSRTWNASTVAEFRRYDLNGDGVITAEEAAAAR